MRYVVFAFLLLASKLFAIDLYPPPGNLDSVWHQYCGKGATFHYAAGDYYAAGGDFNTFASMQSGDHHIGAGTYATRIHLIGAHQKAYDGAIFASWGRWVSNWSCSYLTLDVNAMAQPKWVDPLNQLALSAVYCWGGDHITMEGVQVIGWGTPVPGSECFPVSFISNGQTKPLGATTATMDYILVQDCFFSTTVTGNKDGVSVVSMVDDSPDGVFMGPHCAVNNCYFLRCLGDFAYCHCVGAPVVTNCYAVESDTFWFTEPTRPIYTRCGVFIDNNRALQMHSFVGVKTHPGGEIGDAEQGADFIIGPNNVTKLVYP